jgi:hypothetical protein
MAYRIHKKLADGPLLRNGYKSPIVLCDSLSLSAKSERRRKFSGRIQREAQKTVPKDSRFPVFDVYRVGCPP